MSIASHFYTRRHRHQAVSTIAGPALETHCSAEAWQAPRILASRPRMRCTTQVRTLLQSTHLLMWASDLPSCGEDQRINVHAGFSTAQVAAMFVAQLHEAVQVTIVYTIAGKLSGPLEPCSLLRLSPGMSLSLRHVCLAVFFVRDYLGPAASEAIVGRYTGFLVHMLLSFSICPCLWLRLSSTALFCHSDAAWLRCISALS